MTKQLSVLILISVLSGCASGKLQVAKHEYGNPSTGIVYALPKTLVKVELPYKLTFVDTLDLETGAYSWKSSANRGTVVVSTIQVPDPDNYYEIQTDLPNSFTWQNSFTAELTEQNFLSRAETSFKDNTLSVIKGFVELATILPVLPLDQPTDVDRRNVLEELKELEKSSNENRKKLRDLLRKAATASLTAAEVKALKAEIDLLMSNQKIIEDRMAVLMERKVKSIDVAVVCVVAPNKLEAGSKGTEPYSETTINSTNCKALENFDSIFTEKVPRPGDLPKEYTLHISSSGFHLIDKPSTDATNAYFYRLPFQGDYSLKTVPVGPPPDKSVTLSTGTISVSQFGNIGKIHVKGTRFAKKTVGVSLHPTTGGLKSYTASNEGTTGEAAVLAAKEISGQIQKSLEEPSEAQKLKAEVEFLKLQLEKLKTEKELEAFEKTEPEE